VFEERRHVAAADPSPPGSFDRRASRMIARSRIAAVSAVSAALLAIAAPAVAGTGQPSPWQLNLQGAASPIADLMHEFNTLLLAITGAIVVFVMVLLAICIVRFNERANPTPSRTTHNTLIEVVWTVLPVLILVVIAVPSFRLLYAQYDVPKADLTIKATGHQWFWSYEYQTAKPETTGQAIEAAATDTGAEFEFQSRMLDDKARKPDQPRLLAVDNEAVVPVGKVVRVLTTSTDVIHSFAMPSFGIKADAVPGRINETWFKAEREGIYYGQCSELCGRDHAFMPIAIRVVAEPAYNAWREDAKKKFAADDRAPASAFADATVSAGR
jgi:cytochrome c oxidase subunit 2